MKTFAALAVLLLSLAGFPQLASAATTDDAKAYGQKVGTDVLAILDDKSNDDNQKLDKLEALFVDVVDVKWIGRFVLGTHWRAATPEQQAAYLDAYGTFLIKNYTSNFAEYGGETFIVTTAREEEKRPGEFFVRTEIQRKGGQPNVLVDYRLRADNKKGFKVFDIIVEGVSLISTQRSEFGSVVSRQGLDKLTELLKSKTRTLDEKLRKDIAEKPKS